MSDQEVARRMCEAFSAAPMGPSTRAGFERLVAAGDAEGIIRQLRGYVHSAPHVGESINKAGLVSFESSLPAVEAIWRASNTGQANPPPSREERPKSPSTRHWPPLGKDQMGFFRVAAPADQGRAVFEGVFRCPRCGRLIECLAIRNSSAVGATVPLFVVCEEANQKKVGHLFVGTKLTSPVLYFGSVYHCGDERRMRVFFNRALKDGADPHLVISDKGSSDAPGHSDDDIPF